MNLELEIRRLQAWARSTAAQPPHWTGAYPHWDELYRAVERTLAAGPLAPLDADLMLVALAQDDDDEQVLEILASRPMCAFQLAERGCRHGDHVVRREVASLLGRLGTFGAIGLLRLLTGDPDEHVRCQALVALRELDRAAAEEIATRWLDASLEHSRLVALDTLQLLDSPKLEQALARLAEDPSECVRNLHRSIRLERLD